MTSLQLNDRTKEISERIPKKYRFTILNAVIARSIENGSLYKELSLYLSEKELEEVAFLFKITVQEEKKVIYNKSYKPPKKNKEKQNDSEKLFVGFDDE